MSFSGTLKNLHQFLMTIKFYLQFTAKVSYPERIEWGIPTFPMVLVFLPSLLFSSIGKRSVVHADLDNILAL